ncbi:MAG: phosphoribosylaminoimidazolesuccinocarboxamide synthase [Elusimicrobiota bacterium]
MGSVKDLKLINKPEKNKSGTGRFVFSDRYSVFDWGDMNQDIKNKGKALCIIGAWFFDKLRQEGIKTHYLGVVSGGKRVQLSELQEPVDEMEVNIYRVVKPELKAKKYDYSMYKNEESNFLIPLEVIYRNMLPAGSSVFRRLERGDIKPSQMGLTEKPLPGSTLPEPFMDVSTKLESSDRYISWQEARDMAALSPAEIEELKSTLQKVNSIISREAKRMGLENCDGKIEMAYDENRNPVVVDVIGTPDECRFTYEGIPVSKELARMYYRNTEWHEIVSDAKKKYGPDWKENVSVSPPPAPERFNELLSQVYMAFTNSLTSKKWFDTPELKEIIDEMGEYIK